MVTDCGATGGGGSQRASGVTSAQTACPGCSDWIAIAADAESFGSSGVGVEFAEEGLAEYTDIQVIFS